MSVAPLFYNCQRWNIELSERTLWVCPLSSEFLPDILVVFQIGSQ
jgi:hypothetical protein